MIFRQHVMTDQLDSYYSNLTKMLISVIFKLQF